MSEGRKSRLRNAGSSVLNAIFMVLAVLRKPFPDHVGLRALVILMMAAAPFLPAELISLDALTRPLVSFTIALAGWAALDRIVAAFEIAQEGQGVIRAKQVGVKHDGAEELKDLHSGYLYGLGLLVFISVVIGLTVIVSTASITSSLIHHFGFTGPFTSKNPSQFDILLYFADEAGRGATLRLLDELGWTVPEKLQRNGGVLFASFIWAYKASITLLTVQLLFLWISSWFTELDPEVGRLKKSVLGLQYRLDEMELEDMRRERQQILSRQKRNNGHINRTQVNILREQLRNFEDYHDDEGDVDEIRRALRWDKKVKGRSSEVANRKKRRSWSN